MICRKNKGLVQTCLHVNILLVIVIVFQFVSARDTEEIAQFKQQGATREICWEAI